MATIWTDELKNGGGEPYFLLIDDSNKLLIDDINLLLLQQSNQTVWTDEIKN